MRAPRNDEKRVDAALRHWRQGDCVVGEHWFVHRLDLNTPLTEEAVDAAAEGIDLVETEVRGFVIVSQTCDVVRSCVERPYVEIAPLVEVDTGELRTVERARRPRYAFVPCLRERALVGDLDRIMTVEKAVVAGWERVSGCVTDTERRDFVQALARKRTRFAFPDDFTALASKLQSRLQEKHDRLSVEGESLRALREIRVRAAPSWDDVAIDVMLWFIRNDDEPDFKVRNWDQLLEDWLRLVPATGRFRTVDGVVMTLDNLTARDFVESDPLDLDHLSVPKA